MRLTTGTGILLMAAGAVLAFAIHPPRWIAPYFDLIDLGLVLVWVGVLILAVNAYLYMPRRSRPRRQPPPPGPPDSERYAPGRFASPRYSEPDVPGSHYPSAAAGFGASGYPAAAPQTPTYAQQPYRPRPYDDQQTYAAASGQQAEPPTRPVPPANHQDAPTQQMPREWR